jgi:TIR domain
MREDNFMPDVFINYRTGDGDEAASLVERYLSARFGSERIFRAAKSIPPGDGYPESLLDGVRGSQVLLAIIGPGWVNYPGLRDDRDWVRREILTAYESEVLVIPVLKGRKADRLRSADLPPGLERLADVQSLLLDTRDNDADLGRIGDKLADRVPALRSADRAARGQATAGPVHNESSGKSGNVVQVGHDVAGDIFSSAVTKPQGPVHTGKGNLYYGGRGDER